MRPIGEVSLESGDDGDVGDDLPTTVVVETGFGLVKLRVAGDVLGITISLLASDARAIGALLGRAADAIDPSRDDPPGMNGAAGGRSP